MTANAPVLTLLGPLVMVSFAIAFSPLVNAAPTSGRSAPGRSAHFYKPANIDSNAAAAPPQRIVSLAPVLTETLFALNAGGRVVGVTRFCDRPPAAMALPKVGGFIDPQLERILALKPDLVVAMPSRGQRITLDRLREQGIPVLVAFADTIPEVRNLLHTLGAAVDRRTVAAGLVRVLDRKLRAASRALTPHAPRVLIAVGARPLIVTGPGTFADEALEMIGARRALTADSPAWPRLSAEAVAQLNPDLIVAAGGASAAEALSAELAGLGQHRPKIVHAGRTILMRPGPSLADDVATLAQLVHGREGAAQKVEPDDKARRTRPLLVPRPLSLPRPLPLREQR